MPVKTVEKTVNGYDVRIVQFRAVRGFKVKARLLKAVLPVLSQVFPSLGSLSGSMGDILEKNIDIGEMIPKALTALAESLQEEVFYKLLLDLLAGTSVNNKAIDENFFDELFIGNYNMIYQLAYEVVQANNFFDLGGITDKLKEARELVPPVDPETVP